MRHLITTTLLSICFLTFTSCVSTEVIEPSGSPSAENNQIVFKVTAPDAVKTRSDHSEFKLRYVAKIFSSQTGGNSIKFVERKDITEGETENNEIIFDVKPGHYTIMVFADYIPDSYTSTNNQYPDYYYDTSSTTEAISLKYDKNSRLDNEFFNNDNLDCFSASVLDVEKTEAKKVYESFELTRAVAKIRFVDITPEIDSVDISITFNKFYHVWGFYQRIQEGANKIDRSSGDLNAVNLTGLSNENEKELFFFYTFLPPDNKTTLSAYGFSVGGKETNIEADRIPVQRNYITTVKGSFVPEAQGDDPSDEPSTDPEEENGPIYLYVSTNSDWGNTEYELSK